MGDPSLPNRDANQVFAPTAEEIASYRSATSGGTGAIGRDGRLVDAAHMRLAANVLKKAALANRTSPA